MVQRGQKIEAVPIKKIERYRESFKQTLQIFVEKDVTLHNFKNVSRCVKKGMKNRLFNISLNCFFVVAF